MMKNVSSFVSTWICIYLTPKQETGANLHKHKIRLVWIQKRNLVNYLSELIYLYWCSLGASNIAGSSNDGYSILCSERTGTTNYFRRSQPFRFINSTVNNICIWFWIIKIDTYFVYKTLKGAVKILNFNNKVSVLTDLNTKRCKVSLNIEVLNS